MIYKTQIKNKPQHKLRMSSQIWYDILSFCVFVEGINKLAVMVENPTLHNFSKQGCEIYPNPPLK